MIRFFLIGAVVASVMFFGAGLVGRAMDNEAQDRVIFTRGGVTFDCERHFVEAGELVTYEDGSTDFSRGEVSYTNCHNVP